MEGDFTEKNTVMSANDEHEQNLISEPLQLQSSDNPGMLLVSTPLTGNNYLSWNRSMKIALGAKKKLGFIDGKLEIPNEKSVEYEKWKRVDCMILSWILNSISKDIVKAFFYTTSARELWIELEERFGECNGPLLYQLQREISSMTQGNMSVVVYFMKLKKLWDEYACLLPIPVCNCGPAKEVADMNTFNRLIQFLMGLNDTFDHIRNQILVMDPLPTINKAYSMILQVEKQRAIHQAYPDSSDNPAFMTKSHGYARGNGYGRGSARGR